MRYHMNSNKQLCLVILCSALTLQSSAYAVNTAKPEASKALNDPKSKTPSTPKSNSKAEVKEIDFGPFMADLQRAIKKHWFPPKNNSSLATVVLFKVGKKGDVSDIKIDRSSGNAASDKAAIQAVATAPISALPAGAPANVDIQFTFDYNVWIGHTLTRKPLTNEELDRHFTAAKNFVNAGKLLEALREMESVSNSNSPDVGKILDIIVAAGKSEKSNERIKLILGALKVAPYNESLKQTLDTALMDAGMDPKSAVAHAELAKIFQTDKDYDSALAEYKRAYALSGDQKYMEAVVRLAAMKDGESLLYKWTVALNRSQTADNHSGLAYAYEMCSDYDGAEAEYKKALEVDPYCELAKVRLAALPDKATRVSIPAPSVSVGNLANIKDSQKSKMGSQKPAMLNNEGVTLLSKNKFEMAILKFEEALRVDPNYEYARANLGIAYNNCALKSPLKKALPMFRKALWCSPRNNTTRENLNHCLKASGLRPDLPQVRMNLAEQLKTANDFQGAVVEYREALALTKGVAERKKLDIKIKEVETKIGTP